MAEPVVLKVELINDQIRHWRRMEKLSTTGQQALIACAYIDAYQTVRVLHGLPPLT